MKILQIGFFLAPGGAERFIVDLSNELSKTNEVILMSLKDDSVDTDFRRFYLNDVSDTVKYVCLGLSDGLSVSKWFKILKAIQEINPDVVHFHGDDMPWWMLFPIAFASRQIKFVQTIHNDIHNGYDGFIYKLMTFLFPRKVKYAALSLTNYKEMVRVYPRVVVRPILNGRAPLKTTDYFDSVQKELNASRMDRETKILLHVARCHPIKNQMRLVRAFNRFIEDGGNAELMIIGPGFDTEDGKYIKSQVCDRIHFLGSKHNVSDYFICCDGFCLSSDFEGMPITVLESLLSGKPVLSTPVCGAVDVITDGENGVLSKDFSDDAYYYALKRFCSELPFLTQNVKEEASEYDFTIKKCALKYMDLYRL